jgi:hypothetical protein
MEVLRLSEKLVNVYQITKRHTPEYITRLYICSLLNDADNNWVLRLLVDCRAIGWQWNVWKEAAIPQFEVLFQYLPGGTGEIHEKSESG